MGILIQEMVDSQFSFIIHTVNPMNDDQDQVYMEVAVGQGETLASANQQGTPYRMIYHKKEGKIQLITFSSYSYGLYASKNSKDLVRRCIDYSKIEFTKDTDELAGLGIELGEIAVHLEKCFNGEAQDIEGCICPNDEIYIV